MNEAQILPFPNVADNSKKGQTSVLEQVRRLEAILFAAREPVPQKVLVESMPEDADIQNLIQEVRNAYQNRGVNLVKVGKSWAFRTAPDLSFLLQKEVVKPRKLSKAAMETLAIIAYHQPVTRAEIEEIRGVTISKGTLDVLMETGWVKLMGRRKSPGRPVTYGTSEEFLDHFSLASLKDLPGLEELKGAGLLQAELPTDFPTQHRNDDSEVDTDSEIDDDSGAEEDTGVEDTVGEEEEADTANL